MADMNDLANLMQSVDVQIKEQTEILKSILDLQQKEAVKAEERFKLSKANTDTVQPKASTPSAGGQSGADGDGDVAPSDNTLAGLLGGLAALFGKDLLGRFSILAAGAAALAASVGATIGVIQGQMTAIRAYFKLFTPSLVKIFDDFKTDFRIRVAFMRVAVEDAFNNFIKNIKGMFPARSSSGSVFTSVISAISKALDPIIEPFRTALKTLKELAGPRGEPGKIAGVFKSISGWFGSLGAQIAKIAGVVGKLFAPIAIIMTAFETIKGAIDGYAEGGILGMFEGALSGFFTSLIAAPLDLLKNVVSWVAGALGFEKAAEVLDSFSFTDIFKQIIGSIFDGISSAFSVLTELFTFTDEDKTFFGTLGKLTDIVFLPVNMAINFVKGIFGFEETDEPFKLQDWLMEKVYSIIDWFKGLFSWDEDEADRSLTPRDRNPAPNRASVFQEDYSFASGTKGFANFGQGTRATLHGVEAVVPRNTDAGQMLASNFDDNWKLKLSAIENSGMSSSKPIIINAPNNSQTNVTSKGGTASTIINSFGASRSDLDALSRPAGAN